MTKNDIEAMLPTFEEQFKELINARKNLSKLKRSAEQYRNSDEDWEQRTYERKKSEIPLLEKKVNEKRRDALVLMQLLHG